ncbi:MAG TPA: hypothetical protein VD907_06910 [Verrucomicrobiae bacterium]|nr:hypothetical protein [Verrucomicrobiae bacterium]
MATPFTNQNLAHANRKQLRAIARNINVRQESAIMTTPGLRTAVKAK